MKNNKGFSLVELIVVIAIMAILAAVAIPTFATFINKANVASDEQLLNDIEYAVTLIQVEHNLEEGDLQIVVGTNGVISSIDLGDTNIYTAATESAEAVDTYEIGKIVELSYKFKSLEGTCTPKGDGHWNDKVTNSAG